MSVRPHDAAAPSGPPAPPALVLTRTFAAPRDVVFQAWVDPAHLSQWWGPHGFTTSRCDVDPRPGGAIRMDMRGPDGTVHPMAGAYQEIVAPERLVFSSYPVDEQGKPYFEAINTVRFVEHAGKTTVTLEVQIVRMTPEASRFLVGMAAGWSQSLDRLDSQVAGATDRELLTVRMFDAPRDLVWRAWTEAGHVMQWWGPNGFRTTIHEMDVRPGGAWRFTMHGPDGVGYPNDVVFTEVTPPARLVFTHLVPRFESTVSFDDIGGKTVLALRSRFPTVAEFRQAMERYGAAEGAKQTLGRLHDFLNAS